jgi:PKD repeat protein
VTLAGIAWPLPAAADLDCDRWRPVNPLPITEDLNGVAYRDGVYLAVGDDGAMLTSGDEVSWQVVDSGVEVDLTSVTDVTDAFVVVGDGGTILLGTPDAGWTAASSGTTADLLDVVADGVDVLVAVGPGGTILHSSDGGETWSDRNPGGSHGLLGVAWTGDGFVAVGESGSILTSETGLIWAPIDLGVGSDFHTVACDGSQCLTVATNGTVAVITGDEARVSEPDFPGYGVSDLVWYGDRFLSAGRLYHSFDGETWHRSQTAGLGPETRAIGPSWIAGGDPPSAIIVGSGGTIGHSTDFGEHWKPSNTLTGVRLHRLAANEDLAMAVGGEYDYFADGLHGAILVSKNLDHWEVSHRDSLRFTSVAANADTFMVTGFDDSPPPGSEGLIWRSTDGRWWEDAVESTTGPAATSSFLFQTITWDGGRWIAAGLNGVSVSTDGASWYQMDAGYVSLRGVASNGSTLIAVGSTGWSTWGTSGAILISSDGLSLENVGVSIDQRLFGAAYGDGVFVAVGESGTILTSPDGLTWTPRSSGITTTLAGVRWDDGSFTAVGDNGVALVSPDGVTWMPLDLGAGHDLTDLISTTMGHVASGDHGLLLRPDCSSPDEPPVAGFSWRPSNPEEGDPVRFFDLSTGGPTSWVWDFGNGVTASTPTATHTFDHWGHYPVSLRATNASGSDTATTDVYVLGSCGTPPKMTLTAPSAVPSDQPYTVSWDSVFGPWDDGIYRLYEGWAPSFDDPSDWFRGSWSTSIERTHSWADGGIVYLAGRAVNQCPTGTYTSELSNIARTDIVPDLDDLGEHLWAFPAAATSSGLGGTSWITGVVIHNPDDNDAPAHLVHLPRAGDRDAALGERLNVPARTSLHLDDAMAEFGVDATGALLVVSDRPLHAISRTYNDQVNGTYGQFIGGTPLAGALDPDRIGTVIQLTQDAGTRTNLALANPLPEDVVVDVEAFDASGTPLGIASYTVPGLGSVFESRFLERFTSEPVADAYAAVTPLSPGGKVLALASVVDERTGDPTTQTALEDRLESRGVVVGQVPKLTYLGGQQNRLVAAHNRWIFAGSLGVFVSTDGLEWETISGETARGVSFDGSRILAYGCSELVISDDGVNWQIHQIDPAPGRCLTSVCWDGVQWFGVTTGGEAIATSPDGIEWTEESIEGTLPRTVIRGSDRYLGAFSNGIAHSPDGRVWETSDLGTVTSVNWVQWNGSQYLAGSYRILAVSTDGQNWTVHEPGLPLGGGVWMGDRWVVGAHRFVRRGSMTWWRYRSAYVVSADGEKWDVVPLAGPDAKKPEEIAWNGEVVMGIGYSDNVSYLVGDAPTATVPAVAHVDGFAGARWRSDLELHNPNDEPVDCTIELLERDGANHQPDFRTVTVGASASVRLVDVVGDTFSTDGAGALRITPNGNTILVSSRTYDDADDGTYGQQVPGLRGSDAIWYFEKGRMIGLAHSPTRSEGFRTNIGLVSACAQPMDVEIELFDGEGRALGMTQTFLRAHGVHQLNDVFRQMTDETVANGWAVVRTPTAQCSFYAYASVVDNRTNDPTLIPASH